MSERLIDELNYWLKGEDTDYWYDDTTLFADETIEKFEQEDWDELLVALPQKDNMWKKKLAYTLTSDLHGDKNDNALQILLILLDTDAKEIIETALDSLRDFNDPIHMKKIQTNKNVYEKFQTLETTTSKPVQRMLEAFKQQFYSN